MPCGGVRDRETKAGYLKVHTRTKAVVRRFGKIAKTGGQADGAPFQNQMVLRDRAIATSKKDLQQALVSSFRLHRTKLPFFTTHVFRERSRNKKRPKNDPFVLVFFSFFFRHVSLHCTVYWDAEQVLQLEHHPSCLVLHPGTGQVKSSQGLKVVATPIIYFYTTKVQFSVDSETRVHARDMHGRFFSSQDTQG